MVNISTVTIVLLLVFISFAKCDDTGVDDIFNWSLRQKLKSLENSLLQNENLSTFLNNSFIDNDIVSSDRTKAKRLYDNNRCIEDLEWIKNSFQNNDSDWAFKSKFRKMRKFSKNDRVM